MSGTIRSRGLHSKYVVDFEYKKTVHATIEHDTSDGQEYLMLNVRVKLNDGIIDGIEQVLIGDETVFDRIQAELRERLK